MCVGGEGERHRKIEVLPFESQILGVERRSLLSL